jgi:DNA-binding SARP family transcriptional activator
MALAIHLLGAPRVERDGVPLPAPRGAKAWALLTLLLLVDAPQPRSRVASLLFPEADDPLGALRWNLSELRRLLDQDAEITRDPLRLQLRPDVVVDADVVERGDWPQALALPGFGGELLEGMSFASAASFELWLAGERQHLAGATAATLHEAAVSRLAQSDAGAAADLARRLVSLDPYNENGHVLLVRSLRAGGDTRRAEEHVAETQALFRSELGVEPTTALATAVRASPSGDSTMSGRAAITAQLEMGMAAGHAGAWDGAIGALQRAVVGARALDDAALLGQSLAALGSALVHGVRGADEVGLPALHEARDLARACGDGATAARSCREIAYVELLRAHHPRMERWLADAAETAGDDAAEHAWIGVVAGLGRTDTGDHDGALARLQSACEDGLSGGDAHATAFARTALARVHLLDGDTDEAHRAAEAATSTALGAGWMALAPWPETIGAEALLLDGGTDAAAEQLEHAYEIARHVADPCWESLAERGLGLIAAERDEKHGALDLLLRAPQTCRRFPDTYDWVTAYGLQALAAYGVDTGAAQAHEWVADLDRHATRRGFRTIAAAAATYRGRLGDSAAADVAELRGPARTSGV